MGDNRGGDQKEGSPVLLGAVIVGGIALAGLVGFLLAPKSSASAPSRPKPEPPRAAAAPTTPATQSPPKPRPIAVQLAEKKSINGAVQVLRPMFKDHFGDSVSAGAATLALWMRNQQPKEMWSELSWMPDHSRAEIEKDPTPYRGEKLCVRGTITQIVTDRSAGPPPVFYGVLSTASMDIVRFVAVGSTRGLVEDSPARFCGIVIGIHSYANQGGGTSSGVEAVGLFDIRDNR